MERVIKLSEEMGSGSRLTEELSLLKSAHAAARQDFDDKVRRIFVYALARIS